MLMNVGAAEAIKQHDYQAGYNCSPYYTKHAYVHVHMAVQYTVGTYRTYRTVPYILRRAY